MLGTPEVYVPPIDPGKIPGPNREIYARMGRENIYKMLEDFYRALGESPIRGMFPKDLVQSSQKSAAFFVQLLGGPPEYQEKHGAPRMRSRHLAFPITQNARDTWVATFEKVLENAPADYGFPPEHLDDFRRFLRDFSLWMVNRAPST